MFRSKKIIYERNQPSSLSIVHVKLRSSSFHIIAILVIGILLPGCTHMIRIDTIPKYSSQHTERLDTKVLLVIPDSLSNYTYKKELPMDKWVFPLGKPVSDALRNGLPLIFDTVVESDKPLSDKITNSDFLFSLNPSIISFKCSSPPQSLSRSWAEITIMIEIINLKNQTVFSKTATGFGKSTTNVVDPSNPLSLALTLPKIDFASKNSLAISSRKAVENGISLLLNSIYNSEELRKYRKDKSKLD